MHQIDGRFTIDRATRTDVPALARLLADDLLAWAHAYGKERGASLAQLTSDKQRPDAHRFL